MPLLLAVRETSDGKGPCQAEQAQRPTEKGNTNLKFLY